ncbi:MAG TPA: ornithine cyclodeaminase family protein [Stellaceae bacterium]|jgi:ornithine cyclodeaminase/alanine dehydrogenase
MNRPVFVAEQAVKEVLDWPAMIGKLREVYSVEHPPFAGPPRTLARGKGIWMRTLTGVLPGGSVMGTKQFCFPRGRNVRYMITLFDQESGELLALLDGRSITALRTAATTAVAIDRMTAQGSAVVAMLGSGSEAHSHARAVAAVRPIKEMRVFSPTAKNREAFAQRFMQELGVPVKAVASAKDAVAGATLVIGASRALDGKPVFEGAWLTPEMFVASIGATLPEHVEIDAATIERADLIVADMPDEVMEETGCFRAARAAGIRFEDKFVSLNELMAGKLDDRMRAAKQPMFRSVGASLQDLAVAELAYREALRRGLATELPMELSVKGD